MDGLVGGPGSGHVATAASRLPGTGRLVLLVIALLFLGVGLLGGSVLLSGNAGGAVVMLTASAVCSGRQRRHERSLGGR